MVLETQSPQEVSLPAVAWVPWSCGEWGAGQVRVRSLEGTGDTGILGQSREMEEPRGSQEKARFGCQQRLLQEMPWSMGSYLQPRGSKPQNQAPEPHCGQCRRAGQASLRSARFNIVALSHSHPDGAHRFLPTRCLPAPPCRAGLSLCFCHLTAGCEPGLSRCPRPGQARAIVRSHHLGHKSGTAPQVLTGSGRGTP